LLEDNTRLTSTIGELTDQLQMSNQQVNPPLLPNFFIFLLDFRIEARSVKAIRNGFRLGVLYK